MQEKQVYMCIHYTVREYRIKCQHNYTLRGELQAPSVGGPSKCNLLKFPCKYVDWILGTEEKDKDS